MVYSTTYTFDAELFFSFFFQLFFFVRAGFHLTMANSTTYIFDAELFFSFFSVC